MAKTYKPIDLSELRTYSIKQRAHKFNVQRLAGLPESGASFRQWLDALPPFLGVNEFMTPPPAGLSLRWITVVTSISARRPETSIRHRLIFTDLK